MNDLLTEKTGYKQDIKYQKDENNLPFDIQFLSVFSSLLKIILSLKITD